jgi:hypothetical protein
MAINWIFALKAVPWADVVQAAPHIVKGARRLFNSARQSQTAPIEPSVWSGDVNDPAAVHARLSQLEAGLQAVDREQQESAELIRSLAEQNARLVEAIEIMRARVRLLLALTILLALGAIVGVVWSITQ